MKENDVEIPQTLKEMEKGLLDTAFGWTKSLFKGIGDEARWAIILAVAGWLLGARVKFGKDGSMQKALDALKAGKFGEAAETMSKGIEVHRFNLSHTDEDALFVSVFTDAMHRLEKDGKITELASVRQGLGQLDRSSKLHIARILSQFHDPDDRRKIIYRLGLWARSSDSFLKDLKRLGLFVPSDEKPLAVFAAEFARLRQQRLARETPKEDRIAEIRRKREERAARIAQRRTRGGRI